MYGLSDYVVGQDSGHLKHGDAPTIILGYAKMKEEDIMQAVRLLDKAWG